MASKVEIVNLAFSKLGADTIGSFTEDSEEARKAAQHYENVKLTCLSSNLWRFNLREAQLSRLTTAPSSRFTYGYQLPADFLALKGLKSDTSDYSQEGDKLLSNSEQVTIFYTAVVDEADMPLKFQNYLSAAFAADIALSLTEDQTKTQLAITLAERERGNAIAWELHNNPPINYIDPHVLWVDAGTRLVTTNG